MVAALRQMFKGLSKLLYCLLLLIKKSGKGLTKIYTRQDLTRKWQCVFFTEWHQEAASTLWKVRPMARDANSTWLLSNSSGVGCPRNNQIFFSVRTETNRNSICFGCFSVCFAKPNKFCFSLFRCFGSVSKQPKQTEKISQKQISIGVSSKQLIFFSVRTETQPVSVVFRFVFFVKPNKIFCGSFRCFGPISKQPKQTELMVWGIKKVYLLTNLLLFKLVFCLFRLFRNIETPCFDIKAKQPKQTSCFW
jgi:hypothetical protein